MDDPRDVRRGPALDDPRDVRREEVWDVPLNVPPQAPTDASRDVRQEAALDGRQDVRRGPALDDPRGPALDDPRDVGALDFPWDQHASDIPDDTDGGFSEDDDGQPAMGRISKGDWDVIKEGLAEVQRLANVVAAKTGLSSSQVFKQWTLASRRTHVGRNTWNLYSKYFKDHQKEELARLEDRKYL